jgi:NADPH-dependent methylglyoxal reductase
MSSTILLTGASGSLGASTLAQLLTHPEYTILAVLRSLAKSAPHFQTTYPEAISGGRLQLLEIRDLTVPGNFDGPATKADMIMHIATPFSRSNFEETMIKPTWQILHSILTAADKSPRTKRVIVTGSQVSLMRIPQDLASGRTITEEDFNPITLDEAGDSLSPAYQYSKTSSEQRAWSFMKEKKRSFDVIFLLAPTILGRSIQPGFRPDKGGFGGQPMIYQNLFDVERPGPLYPHFA